MSNPWFRLYNEFANDPVIQSLGFAEQRHFVVLMCLKNNGVIDRNISKANKERIICRGLGLTEKEAEKLKNTLIEFDLIDKNWQIKNWDKRQFISDNSTRRSRKSRKNKETCNVAATEHAALQQRDCNAPETDTETDTETEEKNTKKSLDFSCWPSMPNEQTFKDWKQLRKTKRAPITQTVVNTFGKQLTIAASMGYSVDQCLGMVVTRGWQGFEAEWMKNDNVVPLIKQAPQRKMMPMAGTEE